MRAFLAGGFMKVLRILIVVTAVFSAAICQAHGLTKGVSIKDAFIGKSLSMESYLSKQLQVKGDEGDLRGNIYEFQTKSPVKAFVYSLVIPGAGQYYNGSRIKAGSFLAADILLWSGYLVYHKKGADRETAYKSYADEHYLASVFRDWWNGLDTATQNTFSHRLYFDASGNPIRNREYYENVGKYDQFQVGWDDIGVNFPPPGTPGGNPNSGYVSPHRGTYLEMRKQSNTYFSRATTFAVVSIGNHLVSAFEAAIGARKFNRGSKQYSLDFRPGEINGEILPFVVASAKF